MSFQNSLKTFFCKNVNIFPKVFAKLFSLQPYLRLLMHTPWDISPAGILKNHASLSWWNCSPTFCLGPRQGFHYTGITVVKKNDRFSGISNVDIKVKPFFSQKPCVYFRINGKKMLNYWKRQPVVIGRILQHFGYSLRCEHNIFSANLKRGPFFLRG